MYRIIRIIVFSLFMLYLLHTLNFRICRIVNDQKELDMYKKKNVTLDVEVFKIVKIKGVIDNTTFYREIIEPLGNKTLSVLANYEYLNNLNKTTMVLLD